MGFTFDEGAALSFLADIWDQGQYLSEGVIFSDAVDHQFLEEIDEFFIDQKDVSPIFGEFWPGHDAEHL